MPKPLTTNPKWGVIAQENQDIENKYHAVFEKFASDLAKTVQAVGNYEERSNKPLTPAQKAVSSNMHTVASLNNNVINHVPYIKGGLEQFVEQKQEETKVADVAKSKMSLRR